MSKAQLTETFQSDSMNVLSQFVGNSVKDFDGDYHGSEAFVLKGSDELAMETWQPNPRHRKTGPWSLVKNKNVSHVLRTTMSLASM